MDGAFDARLQREADLTRNNRTSFGLMVAISQVPVRQSKSAILDLTRAAMGSSVRALHPAANKP